MSKTLHPRRLDLSGNWARTKGAQALTKAIRNGSFHLRELVLRDNQIVESGIVGLVLQGFGEHHNTREHACTRVQIDMHMRSHTVLMSISCYSR